MDRIFYFFTLLFYHAEIITNQEIISIYILKDYHLEERFFSSFAIYFYPGLKEHLIFGWGILGFRYGCLPVATAGSF